MTKTVTPMKRNILVAAIVGLAAFGAWSAWQQIAPQPSAQARAAIEQLQGFAARLQEADARGDRAAAANLAAPLGDTLRQLNTAPGIEQLALNNCRLAAVHLVDGMAAVQGGGRWNSQQRYQAALNDCR